MISKDRKELLSKTMLEVLSMTDEECTQKLHPIQSFAVEVRVSMIVTVEALDADAAIMMVREMDDADVFGWAEETSYEYYAYQDGVQVL